jgi:hypothetical protein
MLAAPDQQISFTDPDSRFTSSSSLASFSLSRVVLAASSPDGASPAAVCRLVAIRA